MTTIEFKMFAGSDGEPEQDNEKPSQDPAPTPTDKPGMTDQEAKLLKEVMEKKTHIKEQDQKIEKLEGALKQFEALGGIDALKGLVEEKQAQQKKDLEAKGEWEKLREQMVSEHEKATAGLKAEIADLQKTVSAKNHKIEEMTVGAAFANSAFLKDKTVLPPSKARAIFGSYFDIGEDGSIVAYDKPRGSEGRTALVDQLGKGVGFDVAMERIITADPDSESLLRAFGGTGTGAGSGTSGAPKQTKPEAPKSGLEMIASGLLKKK